MAIVCPRCNRQYDITLFEFGRRLICECGEILTAEGIIPVERPRARESSPPDEEKKAKLLARRKMARLQRAADRICCMILISDYPEIDIEIEQAKVRELAEELFPGRMDLYEMIYESRFRRLREQFRSLSAESDPHGTWRWEG